MHITDLSVGIPCVRQAKAEKYFQDGTIEQVTKNVIIESNLEVYINEKLALKMVITPKDLPALVIGHLVSEGQVSLDQIEAIHVCEYGRKAKVFLNSDWKSWEKPLEIRACDCSADGILGRNLLPHLSRDNDEEQIKKTTTSQIKEYVQTGFRLIEAFQTGGPIHAVSGGTHSAYMAVDGKVKYEAEDIGRHNALDKVIGMALMDGVDLEKVCVFTSGRVPVDMIQKVIRCKIPVLFSNAVPTDESIELAKEYGVVLFTTARKSGMDRIYLEEN